MDVLTTVFAVVLVVALVGCGSPGAVSISAQNELQCRTMSDETDDASGTVSISAARAWNDTALDAIRLDDPEPTVHARNLYHLSAVLWEIWAAFEGEKPSTLFGAAPLVAVEAGDPDQARAQAMHAAAYTLLSSRYRNSVAASETAGQLQEVLVAWCGSDAMASVLAASEGTAAAYGVEVAEAIMAASVEDGSLERFDYEDVSYQSINDPLVMSEPDFIPMVDPARWQPLSLDVAISQNGIPQPAGPQVYIGPQWGAVTGFALNRSRDEADEAGGLPLDPGPPPVVPSPEFLDELLVVLEASAQLTEGQTTTDIAAEGDDPTTGQPYEPNVVDTADYGRIVAEYWADGPESETPPGHWNVLANEVSDQLASAGSLTISTDGNDDVVDRVEWDVKLYLALNGALHDAAIAAWGTKRHYDYVRPISAIRHYGALGELPEREGLVEVVTAESSQPGQRHADLSAHIGRQVIFAWTPPDSESGLAARGASWMLPEHWVPYQRPTFVTPSFPGYVSGHSTFSRAGAEILTAFTGSSHFPGGRAVHQVEIGDLRHEIGPTEPVELQWGTYREAADEAGVSRIWGGIHVPADDFAGRELGAQVGTAAWERARLLFAEQAGS